MPNFLRAGSYVTEGTSASYVPVNPSLSTFAFVGAHVQGPLTPQVVAGWQQFQTLYGGFGPGIPTNLSLAVFNFFASGGGQCVVVRVVHSTAVTASATIVAAGSVAVITVNANSPGVWGNQISIQTIASTDGNSNDFSLLVYYGGTATANIVERWTNLSMSSSNSRYFAAIVNSPLAGSAYITLSDLGVGTVPVVGGSTVPLSTGVDGTTPTDAENLTALNLLNIVTVPMVVAFPGLNNTSNSGTIGGLVSWCGLRGDCFAVIDPPANQTVAQITGTSSASTPPSGSGYANGLGGSYGSYAATYYPWVQISDPSSSAPNATRTAPPSAFVMGAMASTDHLQGPWKSPAGVRTGVLAAVNGVQQTLAPADLDNLNVNQVNAITFIPGAGITIMGARTLSPVANLLYISVRRLMIYIESNLKVILQGCVWEDNDANLWQMATTLATTFLTGLYSLGAFNATQISGAFYVVCDGTVNTPTTIAAGQLVMQVGVAPVEPAEFISITVTQWANGTSTATEGS